jgi:hypothetical protein
MRRVLFGSVVLVMLLGIASVAFAQAPPMPPTYGDYDEDVLGDVWTYNYPGFMPFERVDVYLWRPPTAYWDASVGAWLDTGWPLTIDGVNVEGPFWGTWWWGSSAMGDNDAYMPPPETPLVDQYNSGPMRRQNLNNEDEVFLYADEFGWYYAAFMHSRDEGLYKCGFPLQWKCNYWLDPFTFVYHSPVVVLYEYDWLMWWPWALDPQDTIGPLEAHTYGEFWALGMSPYYIEPYEVTGYSWKLSDLN